MLKAVACELNSFSSSDIGLGLDGYLPLLFRLFKSSFLS